LNVTFIVADLPGKTGSCGHEGTVQPQLLFTSFIISGTLPSFVNLKSCVINPSVSLTVPKSKSFSVKDITGFSCAVSMPAGISSMPIKEMNLKCIVILKLINPKDIKKVVQFYCNFKP
jgi:hypothetical protein